MLLERDDLRAELRALRDRAAEGDGSLVFLGGEAGSGKTTLVGEFLGSLDRSTLTVVGNCDPLTTPRPLGPLIDFSRDPDAGLDGLDPAAHGTFDLFEIVLDRTRTSIRPMVLVIEDVHWADEATIDFLRFRVGSHRILARFIRQAHSLVDFPKLGIDIADGVSTRDIRGIAINQRPPIEE